MKRKLTAAIISAVTTMALGMPALALDMSAPGELPIVSEEVSYTIVTTDESYIGDLNSNTLTQWIREKTGVSLVFDEVPSDARTEKVNLMLASDELPDAFLYAGISAADLARYGAEGVFIPLNDMIEQYGYYTKQVFEQQASLPGAITAPDGNIYTLPAINECFHCMYSQRAWINREWLDNLGLEYPDTWDELHAVLTAFKQQDANGNGDPDDEIPMMGAPGGWNTRVYDMLFNSFLYYDGTNLSLNEGRVEFAPTSPEYRKAVEAVRQWVDEGLIDRTSFTQSNDQFLTAGSDPNAATVGVGTSATWWSFLPADVHAESDRSRSYLPLSPVEGPDGHRTAPLMSTGVSSTGDFVITDAAQNPEVLFRVFDYMYSDEATLRAQVGEEGIDYTLPAEGMTGINGKPALYTVIEKGGDAAETYMTAMPNLMLSNRTSDFRLGQTADYSDPETQWAAEPRLYNSAFEYYAPYASDAKRFPTVYMTAEESAELAALRTQIDDYTEEQTALFLTGERPMEDWDAFLAEYEALRLSSYLELLQTAYDRQYGAAEAATEAATAQPNYAEAPMTETATESPTQAAD